jgi:AcrR family transcriptional regulator
VQTVREKAKEKTRKKLISAAIALFSKKGIDRPSLDEICAEAGVTRGAFYVHFEDRDALLATVMDEVGSRFLEAFFAADTKNTASLLNAFAGAVQSGEYPLTRRGGMRPHQLLDACARSKVIRKKYVALVEQAIERLERRIEDDQRIGVIRKDVPPRAVSTLLLMLAIGAHTLIDLDANVDPRTLLQTVGMMMLA